MYWEIICIFCLTLTEYLKKQCLDKMQSTSLLQLVVRIAMAYDITFRRFCMVETKSCLENVGRIHTLEKVAI